MRFSEARSIALRAGIVAPIDALEESRALEVTLEGEELAVGPRKRITDIDREAIRQYRNHLGAVVMCCEKEQ